MLSFCYDVIDSTNEEAKRLIRAGRITEPAFVLAHHQTAGKGQFGRAWQSPVGAGLYLSIIERPDAPIAGHHAVLTLSAGIACAEVLRRRTSLDVRIKPINDLYVAERKLGGILIETIVRGERLESVITGIGLNLTRAERPVDPPAASPVCIEELLDADAFGRFDANALVAELVVSVQDWHGRVSLRGDWNTLRQRWEAYQTPGAVLPPPLQSILYGAAQTD